MQGEYATVSERTGKDNIFLRDCRIPFLEIERCINISQ